MKSNINKYLNSGNGILILGILWLIVWIGPALYLFKEDPRWGHNYAIPIIFITVGLAYNINKNSIQITAAISSYITIPTFLGFWKWDIATIVSSVFFILIILLYIIEKTRENELINPNNKMNFWIKTHAITFAYIGFLHMSLIFFFVRWFNPEPYLQYLPIEHHVSTSVFNAMLFIFTIFAIVERNTKKIGKYNIEKIGFLLSILMIILPMLAIIIFGE